MKFKVLILGVVLLFIISCGGGSDGAVVNDDNDVGGADNGSTSDDSGSSSGSSSFSKKVLVFDIPVYATSTVSDEKVLHAAKVLAEYLDNDNDGVADNQLVVDEMKAVSAFMFMASSDTEIQNAELPSGKGQPLYANETRPEGSSSEGFDESLEEILHLITSNGYANAYPSIFGESSSKLTEAMDLARGGKFTSIPSSYPAGAWYTYDDSTCDYSCMATEYIYWSLTSLLGAQDYAGRLDQIQNEWTPNTASKLQSTDPAVYALLTDPQYKIPTAIPDGTYTGSTLTITTP